MVPDNKSVNKKPNIASKNDASTGRTGSSSETDDSSSTDIDDKLPAKQRKIGVVTVAI